MNLEELNIILARGENIRTEFKEARDKVPGSFYHTVVSFLNREGGVIILGADDDGMATGIDPDTFLFQKGSSWAEKGVKLLPKRTITILKLLMICIIPTKIEEIKQLMSFGSRDKLRELYLNPLRREGMIEPIIKDKPNSPEQKYMLTEKGRMFLGGFDINNTSNQQPATDN